MWTWSIFESVFTEMAKANTQSCNKFDSSMTFKIESIIGGRPYKFQNVVFKSTKPSDISNVMVKIVPLDNSWGKNIFWKSYVLFWKGVCFQYFKWCKGKGIVLREVIWRDTEETRVCKICKSSTTFWTSDGVEGALDLTHRKAFLLKYLLLHLWLLSMRYIGQILFSSERMNYNLHI